MNENTRTDGRSGLERMPAERSRIDAIEALICAVSVLALVAVLSLFAWLACGMPGVGVNVR